MSQAAHTAHDEELAVASMMVSSGNAAVNLEHLATGCNRSCESCDWGPDDLVAYAGGHTIILFSLSDAGKCSFRDILVGHRARTNCVSWVRTPSGQYTEAKYVVSGSTDNDVRVWRKGICTELHMHGFVNLLLLHLHRNFCSSFSNSLKK